MKIQFEIDDDISLKYNKKKYIISKLNIKAYDMYGANVAISSRFNVFLDFHQFLSNKNENWIYEKIEVIDKENNNKKNKHNCNYWVEKFNCSCKRTAFKQNKRRAYSKQNKRIQIKWRFLKNCKTGVIKSAP